jgi:hypothetical protein
MFVASQDAQTELETEKSMPSPFISSLVERESRRAKERECVRKERLAAVLEQEKKDISRAA